MNTQMQKYRKSSQEGFTLIELMIVVAIIGILAAIAIPMYQDYVAKSQMTGAYSELAGLKTGISSALMHDDAATVVGTSGGDVAAYGWTDSVFFNSAPTLSEQSGGVAVKGTLDGDVSSGISGDTITLTVDGSGAWTCNTTVTESSYMPTACQ